MEVTMLSETTNEDMFSRMAGYQAFRTGIKATAIFLLGEKQTVNNGIKQDGSMAWM